MHVSETAGRFLQYPSGEPTRNVLRAVHPALRIDLRAALYAAAQSREPATAHGVSFETSEGQSIVDIRVSPADDLAADFLLVAFIAHDASSGAAPGVTRSAEVDEVSRHLEHALETTKGQLRETIEQADASTEELKASNEELQAMNEELRSATEELETSREELHSVNEELTAVNQSLTQKVDQLADANSDLNNLMSATDIATVFLDRDLRIMRFTPSAKALFNFISTDIGRPLSDLSRKLDYPEIVADAEQAIAHLKPAEREVRAGDSLFPRPDSPVSHGRRSDCGRRFYLSRHHDDETVRRGDSQARRDRGIFQRRDRGQGFARHRHELERRGGGDLRLHRC